LGDQRQPPVGLAAGGSQQAVGKPPSGTSGQAFEGRDLAEPLKEKGGGHVVGQVGDDAAGGRPQLGGIDLQGVPLDEVEAAGKMSASSRRAAMQRESFSTATTRWARPSRRARVRPPVLARSR
jgi:hypothetical protein